MAHLATVQAQLQGGATGRHSGSLPVSRTVKPLAPGAFGRIPRKGATPSDQGGEVPGWGCGQPNPRQPHHSALPPNRYYDVLPTWRTRFVLEEVGLDPATTYINANLIGKREGRRGGGLSVAAMLPHYIAAQGPTDTTVPAFIRMLWESDCEKVVMLTRLDEADTPKCARYWPLTVGGVVCHAFPGYGEVTVKTVSSGALSPGVERSVLELSCRRAGAGATQRRRVEHFWCTIWKDHGVPAAAGIPELLELVAAARPDPGGDAPPTVVHCSAGIGRTGAFIAIDAGCRVLATTGSVDLPVVLDRLRDDRGNLVQNASQLDFVHAAVSQHAAALPVATEHQRPSADPAAAGVVAAATVDRRCWWLVESRAEAEGLLEHQPPGAYLLRNGSEKRGCIVLSIRLPSGELAHAKVRKPGEDLTADEVNRIARREAARLGGGLLIAPPLLPGALAYDNIVADPATGPVSGGGATMLGSPAVHTIDDWVGIADASDGELFINDRGDVCVCLDGRRAAGHLSRRRPSGW